MKLPVQCLLIRDGGTRVDLDGTVYHFSPHNDPLGLGRHVCIVENTRHFQRFMNIPEGYALLEDAEPTAVLTTGAPAPVHVADLAPTTLLEPKDSDTAGAAAAAPGWANTQQAVANPGPVSQPEPIKPVTAIPGAESAQDKQDAVTAPALPSEEVLGQMSLDALRAQAEIELGRKPSPKAKEPLLISQIMVARAEKNPA